MTFEEASRPLEGIAGVASSVPGATIRVVLWKYAQMGGFGACCERASGMEEARLWMGCDEFLQCIVLCCT
eukprot:CAMPEP_0206235788 /NCGR_PEP_ID=MMETSP0047_2-20121206/13350_1 /ASSEMBLY_ACC=CAM_ASM_000192 /TAXON_ID=195065 /ORGANISM="Chroomonas mesostigmatica_cf, Strain CCMP1168" /LENGTH=69 /DNA_ID=CAMNT_0053660043 /DNA_START=116 /DNA_END=325 /DNA_ORIENTATION=-